MRKIESIWKNPYARSIPRNNPVMVWINPTKNKSVGIGGRDVLQEKRSYDWLRRTYGQICFASALGTTSTWGESNVQNPGDPMDDKYGPSAYFLASKSVRSMSGGGVAADVYEVDVEVFDRFGKPVLDASGKQKVEKKKYTRAQALERNAREKRKADRAADPKAQQDYQSKLAAGSSLAAVGQDPGPLSEDTYEDVPDAVFDRDEIFAPASHVISISTTSNAGGQKEEASVTVKSYNGLHVGVPAIFGGIGMSWGYSDFTGAVVRGCGFSGYCTGGSVTLDSDGGYTVTATGARILLTIAGNLTTPMLPTSGVTFEDEGGGIYYGNNVISNAGSADGVGRAGTKPDAGLYVISEVPKNFGTIVNKDAAETPPDKPAYRAHMKFIDLVDMINASLGSQTDTKIIFTDDYDQDRASKVQCSAYPTKILWKATPYNNMQDTAMFGNVAAKWASEGVGLGSHLKDVAFSGEFLCKVGAEFTRMQAAENTGISKGINVADFVNALIKHANDCCGNAFGGCCVGFSADKDDRNLYIYDPTWSPGKNKGGGAGFPRTATLTYDVSADMVNAFFAKVKAGYGPAAAQATVINGGAAGDPTGDIGSAIKAVGSNPIDEVCAALQACLISGGNKGQVFLPAKLSVTTDGTCVKYEYLAAFSTGYVPTGMVATPGGSAEFLCTGVSQNVSGGDWTTTLNGTAIIKQ